MNKLFILVIIFIVTSCSYFRSKLPPDVKYIQTSLKDLPKVEKQLLDNDSGLKQNQRWALSYLVAKKNRPSSCQLYQTLSNDKDFPIRQLAFIYTLESCNFSQKELEKVWVEQGKDIPDWLEELYATVSLKLARQNKSSKFIAHFSVMLAKYIEDEQEKLQLLKAASSIDKAYNKELFAFAPRLDPNAPNPLKKARNLEYNREYKKARKLYKEIIKSRHSSFRDKVKAWNRLALTHKKERDRKLYAKTVRKKGRFLKELLKKDPENRVIVDEYLKTRISYSRGLWTIHQDKKSEKILLSLLKLKIENHDILADIYRLLSGLAREKKDLKQSLFFLQKASKLEIKDDSLKEKIFWLLGWNRYLLKQYQQAYLAWEEFSEETSNHFVKPKLEYWKGKALQKDGDQDEAIDIWENLIDDDPYGYYGILARKELNQKFSPIGKLEEKEFTVLAVFEWLAAMEEYESAKNFLEFYSKTIKDEDDIEESLPLYSRIDCYDLPMFQFYRIAPKNRNKALKRNLDIVYPTPFKNEVLKSAKRFKHPPEYIYSIMRQESAFNPRARSAAEAYGLMQLIPKRARELSKRYNIKYQKPEDLYKENINIFMGAALLKDLKEPDFVFRTAYYNASPSVVRVWKKKRFSGDFIEFIEMIPYEETRAYVKLVLRNLIIYKRLISNESFSFPSDLL